MRRIARRLEVILVMIAFAGGCAGPRVPDPVEVLDMGKFRGGMPMAIGDSMGFGVAVIKTVSTEPVTKIKAILVPNGSVHGSITDVYAVETDNWNISGLGVTKWETIAPALNGHEVPLDEYTLTSLSGDVSILFKVRADGPGRSDWSHIELTYSYLGHEYSQVIDDSLTVCTPVTLECG